MSLSLVGRRRHPRHHVSGLIRLIMCLLVGGLLVACSKNTTDHADESTGDEDPLTAVARFADEKTPRGALIRATNEGYQLEDTDTSLSLAYVVRRFGDHEDLAWAQHLVDRSIAWLEDGSDDDAIAARPFVRFMAPAADPPAGLELEEKGDAPSEVDTDAFVIKALWCDELDFGAPLLDQLSAAASVGGYEATHALGSTQLMLENDCGEESTVTEVRDRLAQQVASFLGDGDEPVDDLQLEACALLYWVGNGSLVPDSFEDRVERSQLPEGGWALEADGDVADQHATVWGLRCALEIKYDGQIPPTSWVVR